MPATDIRTASDIRSIPLRRFTDDPPLNNSSIMSWGGIFAGALFGIMLQVWLTMLGVAIGASTIDPLQEANPLRGLAVGSGIWAGLTILIAAFAGGWITGRMSGWRVRLESAIHGAVSWAVSNIANFVLVGMVVGGLASGATKLAGSAAQAAGRSGTVPGAITQVQDALRPGQLDADARDAGDTTAKAVAGSGFAVVAMMFFGLLAGVGGAIVGAPKRENAVSGNR